MARWQRGCGLFVLMVMAVLGGDLGAHQRHTQPRARFAIDDYKLVKVERVGRFELQFTYRARLRNRGDAVSGATAVIARQPGYLSTVDGELTFGPVGANASAYSLDTFTLRRGGWWGFRAVANFLRWDVRAGSGNRPPVANAGPDGTVALGLRAALNGAASSDVDGDRLSYRWRLVSRPAGSAASLESTTDVTAALVPDAPGRYTAELVVSDGQSSSAPDTVVLGTQNSAPVAQAGADKAAVVGTVVRLDGSASSDVDGDILTYQWTVVSRPAGSAAALTGATGVTPSIGIDRPGLYRVRLVVGDGVTTSAADEMDINTSNTAPVAQAGPDAGGIVGQTVALDGSGSTDADGDGLTYTWSFTTVPAGSAAVIGVPTAVAPSFTLDRPGTYVAQLVVSDGEAVSAADTVTIQTINSAPTAVAGADQHAVAGARIDLDGGASTDPDGTPLGFEWALLSRPSGSQAAVVNPSSPTPWFVADRDGLYVMQLVVTDGELSSAPNTLTVATTNTAPVAHAGADQLDVPVGGVVSLNGAQSVDADGHLLTYTWALLASPNDSTAALVNEQSATPSFTADEPGEYVAQLIVNDGLVDSVADTVLVKTANRAPEAVAGPDQAAEVGATVTFDGGSSGDPDGDTVSFAWAFVSSPAGSAAVLSPGVGGAVSFVPDVAGTFTLRLTVTDAGGLTAVDEVSVTVPPGVANVVSVSAPDNQATEGIDTATLRFSRTGSTSAALTATYVVSGSATNNGAGDFAPALSGTITFGVGVPTVDVVLTPTLDAVVEGTDTVTVTLVDGAAYDLGTSSATVSILDPQTPVVTIEVVDATANEVGLGTGLFRFHRTGGLTGTLNVALTRAGTAVTNDYVGISLSVVFAPGQAAADLVITPRSDLLIEGPETVTLMLVDGANYDLGATTAGTVTIVDAPVPTITVVATQPSASENGTGSSPVIPGMLRFTRAGDTALALTVTISRTGTAAASDFVALGTVAFPAGQSTVDRAVTPNKDALVEAPETVIVTVVDGAQYDPGTPASATVTISDN